jgi:WD40 repeat protein
VTIAAPPVQRASPFKGLNPFTEQDADYFFGREGETRVIADNLLATRLTLLYGASGVGKSSLLAAGVMQRLAELPEAVVVAFPGTQSEDERRRKSWRDEPLEAVLGAIHEAIADRGFEVEPAPQHDLVAVLQHYTSALDVEILLILDQFEEYFLYHKEPFSPGTFAHGLVGVLTNPTLAVNVLIAIREDAYASLDHFKGRIPLLYDNYLRVAQLSLEHARDAIEKPVEQYNELVAEEGAETLVEPALIDAVLTQFLSVDVALGLTGKGAIGQGNQPSRQGVEPPYLQLVMQRLWDEERSRDSRWLRLSTLDELGGAEQIVRTHLDEALSELDDKEAAAKVFGRLVTPSGTKIAQLARDLAESENLPLDRVTAVLEPLAAERIVRPVAPAPGKTEVRWEIFHDVLAPAILDWRARRVLMDSLAEQERKRAEAEDEASRRRRMSRALAAVAILAIVAAVAAAFVAKIAIDNEHKAEEAQRRTETSNLVRDAAVALRSDPARALTGAARAVSQERERGEVSDAAVAALRQAVRVSALSTILDPRSDGPVQKAIVTPDGIVTVAGRRIDLWQPGDGAHVDGTSLDGRVVEIAGAPGVVVAGTSRGEVLEWRPGAGVRSLGPVDGAVERIVIGPRGAVVVAGSKLFVQAGDGRMRQVADDVVAVDARGQRFATTIPTGLEVAEIASPDRRTVLTWPRAQRLPDSLAAFSGDGRVIVAASRISDVSGPSVFGGGPAPAAVPVETGNRRQATRSHVRAWDVRSGEPIAGITRRKDPTAVAVDKRGRTLAVAATDGSGYVWRPSANRDASLDSYHTLDGHTNLISSIAFTPDGRWVVTGSGDGTARVWSVTTGDPAATLLGHDDWVSAAAIDPDGRRIVTASDDGTARVWRFPVALPDATADGVGVFGGGSLSADGREIVVLNGRRDAGELVDIASGETVRRFDRGQALAAQFGPDRTVLTASPNHVAAWDPGSGAPVGRRISGAIQAPPIVSADRETAVVATRKGLRHWRVSEGALGPALPKSAELFDFVLSPNGRYVAAHVGPHKVRVWDLSSGELIREFKRNRTDWGAGLAISPDGRRVVIAEGARAAALPLASGVAPYVAPGHADVTTIRFSNDGKLLLTAGLENTARVWDANTGAKLAALRGHAGSISAAAFSPDNRLVITGSQDGTARIWDARSGELLEEVGQDAEDPVNSVAFAADSRRFLSGSFDGAAAYSCVACGSTTDLLRLAHERAMSETSRP